MSPAPNFDDKLFRFLRQLKKNNRRDWFQEMERVAFLSRGAHGADRDG